MAGISICMATYNGGAFIDRQLRSILVQLGERDEVIISDDKSTDDTRKLIEQLNDTRISLIENTGKKGPVGNFENALRHASGDLIFLADQDDVWFPQKISIVTELLNQYDLVLTDCTVVNQNLDTLYPSYFSLRGSEPGFLRNIYKNSYVGCCMAFRRELLTRVLPFPANLYAHDWWIGMLGELGGRVCFYPQPLMFYVRHGKNASPTSETGYPFRKRFLNRFFLLGSLVKRLYRLNSLKMK